MKLIGKRKKEGLVRRGGGEGGEKDGRWKGGKVDVRNSYMKKRTIKGSVTEGEEWMRRENEGKRDVRGWEGKRSGVEEMARGGIVER